MRLSKNELQVLAQTTQGNSTIESIATKLNKDISTIYRTKNDLVKKDLITFTNKTIEPRRLPHVSILLQMITEHPNIIELLSDSGIPILSQLVETGTIQQIQERTNLKKSMIYKKIQQAKQISAIQKSDENTYKINKQIWKDLYSLLKFIKQYEETTDVRIPADSKIYYKKNNEILFSNKRNVDATKTGFSAYEHFGIKILLTTNYYYLPQKKLDTKDIFIHSINITEKEMNSRNLTFLSLFYLKFKKELDHIHHPIIKKIRQVINGKRIQDYPTYEEIMEKVDLYDIKF